MPIYLKKTPIALNISRLIFLSVCLVCCFNWGLKAQKYAFTHYNIEDGLAQSQANRFSQDNSHCLWIATLGGACRFNGKDFTTCSKENGLANNFIYTVYCDSKSRVWFGSHMGLSCLDGTKITNYGSPANVKRTWVTHIVEDANGTIWLTMDAKLFKVNGTSLQYVPVTGVTEFSIINIEVNQAGKLHVLVWANGIYSMQGNKWINSTPLPDAYKKVQFNRIAFDRFDVNKIYMLGYGKLFIVKNGVIAPYPDLDFPQSVSLTSIAQDEHGNLWFGSTNGAYYLKNNRLIHFDAQNGLTDVTVSDIYCDKDNNIWLGTWGDGVYKYEGDAYVVFDQLPGINGFKSVMGIARDKNQNIWLASDGGGLIQYDGKVFKNIYLPTKNPYGRKIQCIYSDRDSNIWIGTSLGGIWKYDGRSYCMISKSDYRIANAISQDANGTIWMAGPLGCFYMNGDTLAKVDRLNGFVASLLPLGKDTMLIGTQYGVRMSINKKWVTNFKLGPIETSNILSMINFGNLVLFGTGDRGLFIWNRKSGAIKNYNVKNGFNSNSIYNMLVLNRNTIWAGTGRGLNLININPATMDCTISGSNNSKALIAEANQNSVLYNDGKVWMGTTKGLIIYNAKAGEASISKPYITIQSVQLFSQKNNKKTSANIVSLLNNGEKIRYDQNHLTISFFGVHLKNPGNVLYQYQLTGLDDKYCSPMKHTMVDYPSLPAGKYTFKVKAITTDGIQSGNVASFSFEITPPFYETWLFRILLLLFFIMIGIALQTYMHKRKLQTVKQIERMKREEKQKIRKQTAEDFHDDLGNKLTRITVLSDILSSKMDQERDDQKKLVGQIKQNAEELYSGTKDILWALDPKSDNLYEILTHIKHFGIELFQDTTIEFEFGKIDAALSNIRLPMEYSRNMTMIYKELLNNILKHASANQVNLTFGHINNSQFVITLTDNGKGFDVANTIMGHGTNNIKNRAARIDGTIDIASTVNVGTKVILNLKLKN
jgi:signal transduction histidine kinase/ligand-binding sensor domain-containing protein